MKLLAIGPTALVLLAAISWVLGQDYNVPFSPRAGAATGEDFSQRATCNGLYFLTDTETDDHCENGSGEDTLVEFGDPAPSNTILPSGYTTSSTIYSEQLDGTGDYFTKADEADWDDGTAVTICYWIYRTSVGTSEWILDHLSGPFTSGGHIKNQSDQNSEWAIDATTEASTSTPAVNTWWHECVSYSHANDEIRLYFNGENNCNGACATVADNTLDASVDWFIGGEDDGTDQIPAHLFEFAVFDEELSATEICQICRCGLRNDVADRTTECDGPDDAGGACTFVEACAN